MTKKGYLSLFIMFSPLLMLISTHVLSGKMVLHVNKNLHPVSGVEISFNFDSTSLSFFSTVCLISGLVLIYSEGYMPVRSYNLFIITLFLFVLSMLIVTLSGNLFWLMVGWDGLGVTSFLLILFFKNWTSFKSGLVTFMLNRLGDVFMILALGHGVFGGLSVWPILLILGAISKSAQLPYSTWLPLAMAAPTPVSSLVHSSTLVTAGVFVLARYMVELNLFLDVLKWISCATLIYAGVNALIELDLKKIIAFSTLSHLSLMILTLSIKSVDLATFHMIMHAVFKSSLFMLAGWHIHMSMNVQSVTLSSSNTSSWAFYSWTVCAMAMAGLPGLSGFYSKELIVLTHEGEIWVVVSFLLGIMLTMAYSVRLVMSLMDSFSKFPIMIWENLSSHMVIPILTGTLLSIFLGAYFSWLVFIETVENQVTGLALFLKSMVLISLGSGSLLGSVVVVFKIKFLKWKTDWGLSNIIEHSKLLCNFVQNSIWEDLTFAYVLMLAGHVDYHQLLVKSKDKFLMKKSLLTIKALMTIMIMISALSM